MYMVKVLPLKKNWKKSAISGPQLRIISAISLRRVTAKNNCNINIICGNISLQYVLILSKPVFAPTLTLTILGRCIPLRFPIFIESLYYFPAGQWPWKLSNRNGGYGVSQEWQMYCCVHAFQFFGLQVSEKRLKLAKRPHKDNARLVGPEELRNIINSLNGKLKY